MNWNRRTFLKTGGLSTLALGMPSFMPTMLQRHLAAAPGLADKKMIFIFQRGGNDGVNTVIPRGDADYNTTTRPTIYIPEANVTANGTDLGNGFAQFHPMLEPMMEIYNNSALNGVDGPGNLAVIHRVGYQGQSQSHFDSQLYWENGMPRSDHEEGMIYRHVEELRKQDPAAFLAAAITSNSMDALKGANSIPTMRNVENFKFSGSSTRVRKFLGALPSAPGGADGGGLLGVLGGPKDYPGRKYRDLVYGTGLTLADSINVVQQAVAAGPYSPSNGAVYPGGSLGDKLLQVAMLMKRTPVRVLGVNIGGWDTHSRQGGTYGSHGDLLTRVAQGFQALYRDLQDQWENLVLCTMTEFGRTSKENGSGGTDHAYATVMCVAGGGVQGGVYNCDSTTWSSGDLFSKNGKYVAHRTDYRSVFAEIFSWMGNTNLDSTIPGYDSLKNSSDFTPLGFMA